MAKQAIDFGRRKKAKNLTDIFLCELCGCSFASLREIAFGRSEKGQKSP